MRKFLAHLLLFCALLSPLNSTLAQSPDKSDAKGVDLITASSMKDYLYFIASDEMEGRDTPSRGLNTTAKFLAMNLSHWGLKPGGDDGTYFQKIKVSKTKTDAANTTIEIGGQSYKCGQDFFALPNSGNITAPLVYASHGWVVKSKNINPYQNLDIKDKLVVIINEGLPEGVAYNDLDGKEGEDWSDPYSYIESHGAKGIILIPTFEALANWEKTSSYYQEEGSTVFENLDQKNFSLPVVMLSPKLLAKVFSNESLPANSIFRDVKRTINPFALRENNKVTLKVAVKKEVELTQNVIGILEGSDPVLKDEYVAIGAHYDHVGIGTAVNGDKIYNGADDDGSGTTSVLQLAEAFSHAPHPKRSIMFVWHCGEEKGLLGSRYLTKFPVVPLDKIVTQLNIDMVGRSRKEGDTNPANNELSGPDEIYVIGSKLMSTELGQISESVNSSHLNLKFNYKYDDPNDPNRFFFRSDHFNYARKGIPIIFYFNGVHEDYHKPSDSPDKIDFKKMEKVARTVYFTALELANRPNRPKVDKPLPAAYSRDEE